MQQGVVAVQIPDFSFASVQAKRVPCSAVGGDFFDVVVHKGMLNVALADLFGKGISAAIVASTLPGMLYVQLQAQQELPDISPAVNRYLCRKDIGKYATMLLLRLQEDGAIGSLNRSHIQPRFYSGGTIFRLHTANIPMGLPDGRKANLRVEPRLLVLFRSRQCGPSCWRLAKPRLRIRDRAAQGSAKRASSRPAA